MRLAGRSRNFVTRGAADRPLGCQAVPKPSGPGFRYKNPEISPFFPLKMCGRNKTQEVDKMRQLYVSGVRTLRECSGKTAPGPVIDLPRFDQVPFERDRQAPRRCGNGATLGFAAQTLLAPDTGKVMVSSDHKNVPPDLIFLTHSWIALEAQCAEASAAPLHPLIEEQLNAPRRN